MKHSTIIKAVCAFLSLTLMHIEVCAANGNIQLQSTATNVGESYILSTNDIPPALSSDFVYEKGHTTRKRDKEPDLNTIVFSNRDNSETMYIFGEPVKYIDANNDIIDKSNLLYSTNLPDYKYTNKYNDIQTFLPEKLNSASGIMMKHESNKIVMYPLSTQSSLAVEETLSGSRESVSYGEVFGTGTSLSVSATYSGFYQEIVLQRNVGNSFSFALESNELIPKLENGCINFYLSGSDKAYATINGICIFDSSNASSARLQITNSFYGLEQLSTGKYKLTVTIDSDFLNNKNTVYPIKASTSITITATGSGSSKTILDTPYTTEVECHTILPEQTVQLL